MVKVCFGHLTVPLFLLLYFSIGKKLIHWQTYSMWWYAFLGVVLLDFMLVYLLSLLCTWKYLIFPRCHSINWVSSLFKKGKCFALDVAMLFPPSLFVPSLFFLCEVLILIFKFGIKSKRTAICNLLCLQLGAQYRSVFCILAPVCLSNFEKSIHNMVPNVSRQTYILSCNNKSDSRTIN